MTATTLLSSTAAPVLDATAHGLACRGLASGYLGQEVLHEISFEIGTPGVYVVLGPNGAGKTTLFRTLAGILRPLKGEAQIGRWSSEEAARQGQVHYLSHLDGMPEGLRVREALDLYARVERAAPADVDRVLDSLALGPLADRYLSELSAGQRKRVSVGRIFLQDRGIYLLDEPTANLDPKVAREIRTLILGLAKEKVVLYSSHNLFEAREIGRFVLAIKGGRLQYFGPIEQLRAARFVVGVRVLGPTNALADWPREGDYFTRELAGPEEVPPLLRELDAQGVRVRELREMNNPLEDLFT